MDGFEQWWKENGKSLIKSQPDYKATAEEGFRSGVLHAESMVREEEEGIMLFAVREHKTKEYK